MVRDQRMPDRGRADCAAGSRADRRLRFIPQGGYGSPWLCIVDYGEEADRSKETVMKSKAAIQVEPGGPLVIEEIDIPDPGPNQVT